MNPTDTASNYDQIALKWQKEQRNSTYGITPLERAIQFVEDKHSAIDIGCGSSGRLIQVMLNSGLKAEGLDVSSEMIRLAKEVHPNIPFYHTNVGNWIPTKSYSLVVAWDSTFHVPLFMQASVTKKMCDALAVGGVLLFTCGGGHVGGQIKGSFSNLEFEYSTLGIDVFLRILTENQCTCRHLEYDQYPENHVYIIAQKSG